MAEYCVSVTLNFTVTAPTAHDAWLDAMAQAKNMIEHEGMSNISIPRFDNMFAPNRTPETMASRKARRRQSDG